MLFPEAEVTRSLSNMIKAYSVRYKEEMKKIDVTDREEEIHAKMAEAVISRSFVGGLNAINLTESGEIPAIADLAEGEEGTVRSGEGRIDEDTANGEAAAANDVGARAVFNEAAMEAWREEEREKIKAQITGAERLAMKIELEKSIRTQADIILEQARVQGETVKEKARQAAEEERAGILEAARREGYEEGRQKMLQEQEAMEAAFAEKERLLSEEFERKQSELEPMATDVIVKLLESLTGVCL